MAAPVSSNRSPKFDNGPMELYKSGNCPNSKNNCPHSPLSQTNSSGSYRSHLLPQQQQQQSQQQQPPQQPPPPPQQQQTPQPSPQAQSATPSATTTQQILYSSKIPLKYSITGTPQPSLPQPPLPQPPSPCEKPLKPISRNVSRRDSFKQHRLLQVDTETSIEPPSLSTEPPKTDPSANIYSLPPPLPVSHPPNMEPRMLPKNIVSIPAINYSPPSSNQNLTSTTVGIDHVVAPWATSSIRPVPLEPVSSWATANSLPPAASADKLCSTQIAGAWANGEASVQDAWNKNLADQIVSSMSTNPQWKNLPPEHTAWPADAISPLVSNDCRGFSTVEAIGPKHSLPDILRGELPSQRPNETSLLNALPTASAIAPSSTSSVCDILDLNGHPQPVEAATSSIDKCTGAMSAEQTVDNVKNQVRDLRLTFLLPS